MKIHYERINYRCVRGLGVFQLENLNLIRNKTKSPPPVVTNSLMENISSNPIFLRTSATISIETL